MSTLSLMENGAQIPEWIDNECVGEGWHHILRDLHGRLAQIEPDYRVFQIKEKFGGLRVYTYTEHLSDDDRKKVYAWIGIAEEEAWKTCEACGEYGSLRTERDGEPWTWVRTLCDQHAKQAGYV